MCGIRQQGELVRKMHNHWFWIMWKVHWWLPIMVIWRMRSSFVMNWNIPEQSSRQRLIRKWLPIILQESVWRFQRQRMRSRMQWRKLKAHMHWLYQARVRWLEREIHLVSNHSVSASEIIPGSWHRKAVPLQQLVQTLSVTWNRERLSALQSMEYLRTKVCRFHLKSRHVVFLSTFILHVWTAWSTTSMYIMQGLLQERLLHSLIR